MRVEIGIKESTLLGLTGITLQHKPRAKGWSFEITVIRCHMAGFYPLGGAGGKLPPQTPKLLPQNVVTDHGIQEIFGLNCIKSDLKTSQNQTISWGILPQTPYTMCTSVVSYYICCTIRRFPSQKYFSR